MDQTHTKTLKSKTVLRDLIYKIEIETFWVLMPQNTGHFETVAKLYLIKQPDQPPKFIYQEQSNFNNHPDITRWARNTYLTGVTQ